MNRTTWAKLTFRFRDSTELQHTKFVWTIRKGAEPFVALNVIRWGHWFMLMAPSEPGWHHRNRRADEPSVKPPFISSFVRLLQQGADGCEKGIDGSLLLLSGFSCQSLNHSVRQRYMAVSEVLWERWCLNLEKRQNIMYELTTQSIQHRPIY